MLRYVNFGARQYAEHPVRIYGRKLWEFQAVLRGSICVHLPEGPELLRSRRLWLFPPSHQHGWLGEKGKTAEIAVFHFQSIPEPLRQLSDGARYLDIPITEATCRRLRALAHKAARYWEHPSPGMMLYFEQILLELSLLFCEHEAMPVPQKGNRLPNQRVSEALEWYGEHMAENPGLGQIAFIAGTSASHMRRLFHEVLHSSPKQVLDQMRFQRAIHLMADPNAKLSTISDVCGFGSPSSFSRAFKAKYGCSPENWRT
jgi:AraC family transcriptional regulator